MKEILNSKREYCNADRTATTRESFLWLLRHTNEPQKGETAVYGYNPALF